MTLTVSNLSKSFGQTKVLDSVCFEAVSGKPLGLLGRNGAGKTTVMRIIMGILSADHGQILLDGQSIPHDLPLGYLPEERGLYRKTRVSEQLVYFARLRGMSASDAKRAVEEKLEQFSVLQYRDSLPETLSKGTQQRIQLALAMINDPDILILDEPFSGLDPVSSLQLKTAIREYSEKDKIVIFSSHQMSNVEDFCSSIVIINSGSVALCGELSELRAQRRGNRILINAERDHCSIIEKYGKFELSDSGIIVDLAQKDKSMALLGELHSAGAEITKFEAIEPTLEEIFISCVGEEGVAI